jgi:transcriptional regulator with XRE-family HTH domain
MEVLASSEERRQLEALEERIELWMQSVREQADAVDTAQMQAFLVTAQNLALRLDARLPPSLDPTVVNEIRGILIGGLRRVEEIGEDRPLDILDDFLLRAESIRHIVRDALDEDLPLNPDDGRAVLGLLEKSLPRVPKKQIARLVGVDERTLQRWATGKARTSRRLYLVAKLVSLLKDAWTPEGVVAWFDRPRAELDERSPLDVIENADYERYLIHAAREGRAQHGS